jgi:hypothetical protein
METWTWRHGHGDMEMETWTWKHGHGDMGMETWTWRHGHRDMELKCREILTFYEKLRVSCTLSLSILSILLVSVMVRSFFTP